MIHIYRWVVHEYKIGDKTEADPVECGSCRYHAPLRTFKSHTEHSQKTIGPLETERRHLCGLCANSMCSSMTAYPTQYPDYEQAILTVYCANAVLDQLGKFKGAPVHRTDDFDNLVIP